MGKSLPFMRRRSSRTPGPAESLRRRFVAFQELLAANNEVLEMMADMEEKRSGEFLFDRAYLSRSLGKILPAARRIVAHLETLSRGRYPGLAQSLERISARVAESFAGEEAPAAEGPLVLPLAEVTAADVALAGGKMAHLGEIRNRVGLRVPDGFVVTSAAYRRFIEFNRLTERIDEEMVGIRADRLADVEAASVRLRRFVREAPLPPEVLAALDAGLGAAAPQERFSVRSSAVREDGELSFAGQYVTYLGVPPAQVAERYRDVLASLFTPRAVFYCLTQGFAPEKMVMAVGVLRMVEAASAGVAYSRDPNDPARSAVLVSAARGLGVQVVEGSGRHDGWTADPDTGAIRERRIARKDRAVVAAEGGGTREEPLAPEAAALPALTDAEVAQVARAAAALERHYGVPQDVEWALDPGGDLLLLQSRPLRLAPAPAGPPPPREFPGHAILLEGGEIACRGVGAGPVALLREDGDLASFPDGGVLVARNTSTLFVAVMPRAAAIVTDVGGAAGHMASLAREFAVPTLLDTGRATRALSPGEQVTVDALRGAVYAGRVEPLLAWAASRREPLRETPLLRTLGEVLRWIAPLNLTDPASAEFRPESCRTLHDVTRFAHEKAMEEMFEAGSERELAAKGTIPLLAGIPVGVHLLDLGGGVRPGARSAAPDDVLSVPMAAVLRGMTAMRWPGPPPVDAGGFLGMIAHTATIPEEQILRAGEKSFAVLGPNYVHFSIRLGYHFSLIEAWAGERMNDNYVRFFFKGGGAGVDRRLRRVRLIAEILRRLDFQVRIVEDVIDAAALKYPRPDLEEKLEALGRLTAYTKQLDMAMFNDDVTDWYRDEFIRDHLPRA